MYYFLLGLLQLPHLLPSEKGKKKKERDKLPVFPYIALSDAEAEDYTWSDDNF